MSHMDYNTLLLDMIEKEKRLNLYKAKVIGAPFWRIVRFKTRVKLLKHRVGFSNDTRIRQLKVRSIIRNFFISFKQYLKLFFKKKEKIENIIFALPRLHKVGEVYLDKFSDPVISQTKIKESFLIFQKPLSGAHKQNRYCYDKVIKTDFIEFASRILGLLTLPFVSVIFFSALSNTYRKAKLYFGLTIKDGFLFGIRLGSFVVMFVVYYVLFKKIRPRRIFIVSREVFFPIILAAKKSGIEVYEFQHGATNGETPLYSGLYNEILDPDFFLSFGDAWIGDQFGIPTNKIINIGWAYQNFIHALDKRKKYSDNVILVISDPYSGLKILKAVVKIAELNKNCIFHIRLHPQESYTKEQLDIVEDNDNIIIQSNKIESAMALLPYQTVLGENSTVLYEALSYGKRVGRLSFGGVNPEKLDDNFEKEFQYIKSAHDFNSFLQLKTMGLNITKSFYSDFSADKVNALLQ